MVDLCPRTPKRLCGDKIAKESEKFSLEDLSPEVLKRFVISSDKKSLPMVEVSSQTPSKRRCGDEITKESEKFPLEDISTEVLILNAKKSHYDYITPEKFKAFRTEIDFEEPNELDEIEPPKAPKRKFKTRSFTKELASISVELFPSQDEEGRPYSLNKINVQLF